MVVVVDQRRWTLVTAWPGSGRSTRHTPVDHLEWRYCADYSVSDSDRPSKSRLAENTAQTELRLATGRSL